MLLCFSRCRACGRCIGWAFLLGQAGQRLSFSDFDILYTGMCKAQGLNLSTF